MHRVTDAVSPVLGRAFPDLNGYLECFVQPLLGKMWVSGPAWFAYLSYQGLDVR